MIQNKYVIGRFAIDPVPGCL